MKVIEEKIGDVTVFIQTIEENSFEIMNETSEKPNLMDTGIEEELKGAYTKLKSTIRNLVEDIANEFNDNSSNNFPDKMEIEFNMGLSTQAGIWIIGVQNDYALKVKMIWNSNNK